MSGIFSKLINAMNFKEEEKEHIQLFNRYPYSHYMIKQILENNISSERIMEMINIIKSVSKEDIERINNNNIIISQRQWLVSDEETRGADLIVDSSIDEGEIQATFDEHLDISLDYIGNTWRQFIMPLKTVTYINVPGFKSIPFFSGSNSFLFGAICISPQTKPWITAEVLTHESAHHWLFLIEENKPDMADGWDDNIFYSPWREDPRPTMGLIHGIYVFSCVASALWSFYKNNSFDISNEDMLDRICFIVEQVRCACKEINKSNTITDLGISICKESEKIINQIHNKLPSTNIHKSRKKVKNAKNARINENGVSKYA